MKSDLGVLLPGGKTGVLLLHDVGGSAAELRAHAGAFQRAGYSVSCPQLIALGGPNTAGQGSAGALVSEAEQALAKLKARCDNVVVVGIAYGAMLGLELARHNAIAVQAVVLVEPRAWLPSLPFTLPAAMSGRFKQTWLAGILGLTVRMTGGIGAPVLPAAGLLGAAARTSANSPSGLREVARLLDSVHAGLPAIKQPVLMMHRAGAARSGLDGSFLLQRRLGGRVESVMAEARSPAHDELGAEVVAERSARFVSTILDEIETRRGNELRRQKTAAGRTNAA